MNQGKNFEDVLTRYWSNEKNIKEAKHVFFEKGIIKRELVEDQLAFSWLRCKYKNISHETLTTAEHKQGGKRIPINQIKKQTLPLSEIWIGLYTEKFQLLAYTGSIQLAPIFSKAYLGESVAGTNGISLCLETGKKAITVGLEHYSNELESFVTIGLPLGTMIVGIILPLQITDDELVEKAISYPYQQLFHHEIIEQSEYHLSLYFFNKEIQVYKSCYQQFAVIANRIPLLRISSHDTWEGYALAREIHGNSIRSTDAFVYLCKKDGWNLEEQGFTLTDFKGTLVIEDLEWFPLVFQREIARFIDSKLINSKPYKSLYKSDIAIIIIKKIKERCNESSPQLYLGLQSLLANVNLIIPSFNEIGQQFKSYLYNEIETICESSYNASYTLSDEALNLLTQYSWKGQYSELLHVVDYIMFEKFEGDKIPVTALPSYILKSSDHSAEGRNIKEQEKMLIEKTLKQNKGNIKKSAEQLGITRTTLYKKITEYGIQAKNTQKK